MMLLIRLTLTASNCCRAFRLGAARDSAFSRSSISVLKSESSESRSLPPRADVCWRLSPEKSSLNLPCALARCSSAQAQASVKVSTHGHGTYTLFQPDTSSEKSGLNLPFPLARCLSAQAQASVRMLLAVIDDEQTHAQAQASGQMSVIQQYYESLMLLPACWSEAF